MTPEERAAAIVEEYGPDSLLRGAEQLIAAAIRAAEDATRGRCAALAREAISAAIRDHFATTGGKAHGRA